MKNIIELIKKYFLYIVEKHTGKMEGMASLSTNPNDNKQCEKNCQVNNAVCKKCFSKRMMKMYKALAKRLHENYLVLTKELIPADYLPLINKMYFRFEAFGDLDNETHFINYLNIAKKNPHCTFAIWTKNPQIIKRVFDAGHEKPENLIIIVSSLFLNTQLNIETLKNKLGYTFIDKVFTVYTKDYLKAHPEIVINCGSLKCLNCLKCYTHNALVYINEILK